MHPESLPIHNELDALSAAVLGPRRGELLRAAPADVNQPAPADVQTGLVGRRGRILTGSDAGCAGRITQVIPNAYHDDPGPRVRVEWPVVTLDSTCPLLSDVELLPDTEAPRPVHGPPEGVEPAYLDEDTDEPRDHGVGWDLSFGCRLTIGYRDGELCVIVNTSDRDQARGITSRTTTTEQVATFARNLLALVEPEDQARGDGGLAALADQAPQVDPDVARRFAAIQSLVTHGASRIMWREVGSGWQATCTAADGAPVEGPHAGSGTDAVEALAAWLLAR